MSPLTSQLFGASPDLENVRLGQRRILAPESSDSVALLQQGLVALGYQLPAFGIDGGFGTETGDAVTNFKLTRGLNPSDPVVGVGTITALDSELSYLEGSPAETSLSHARTLALDPAQAGFIELRRPELNLTELLTDFFQFGDRICFRLSFVLGTIAAQAMGKIAEDKIFEDYRTKSGLHDVGTDFFDDTNSSTPYVNFLLTQHPNLDAAKLGALGQKRRPDLMRNKAGGAEWYEIKPVSIAGAVAAWKKLNTIPNNYADAGLPYVPGSKYMPTEFIHLQSFGTDHGENLELVLHARRMVPGLIFWEICVKGDYVRYFNRVRLTAGILALIAALAVALAPAAAGAVIAAITALATELGLGALPVLIAL